VEGDLGTRLAAAQIVLAVVADDVTEFAGRLVTLDIDTALELPEEIREQGERFQARPTSSPIVRLPAKVLARYALGMELWDREAAGG
jgi:hypothetical protein